MKYRLKPGDLIEITWVDATLVFNADDITEDQLRRGGTTMYTVGYLSAITKAALVLVSELDEERQPCRDANIIPRGMVRQVKLIAKGRFGK